MKIAVHVTHESVKKIGGIGSVLSGVCNLRAYEQCYDDTVFYGPLFDPSAQTSSYLRKSGELLFSSHDNFGRDNYLHLFEPIMQKYAIDIVYGERKLVSEFDISRHCTVKVINIGINKMAEDRVEDFKFRLWERFGIESNRYRDDWDYEQYLRIAVPYLEILGALFGPDAEYCHFAHEYMGVPAALSVLMDEKDHTTVFVAHEVTTARSIIEDHQGHDVSFYNILRKAKANKTLEQLFGSQEHNPRSELIKRAMNFDHIFAVGDHVRDEYLFLVPETPKDKIKIVYNGISARTVNFEQKLQSRAHIEDYVNTLLNFRPNAIFTHVTRMVVSKGIWRDIALLYVLDRIFDDNNLTGACILLSTVIGTGRDGRDIFKMEADYGWPVLHREGWPDLIGDEKDAYNQIQVFNARSKAIKAVFLNQFGFSRTRCGKRVPEDAEFDDLRIASDAEFGFSIYEPFGIAQIETIPFGGVSLLSSSCGSAALLRETFRDAPIKPFVILDFISAGGKLSLNALKNLSTKQRDTMEHEVLQTCAQQVFDALPLTDEQRRHYLENAHKYAPTISWDHLAEDYAITAAALVH